MKTTRGALPVKATLMRVAAGSLLAFIPLSVAVTPSASATAQTKASELACHKGKSTIQNQRVSATEAKGRSSGSSWLYGATDVNVTSFDPTTGIFTEASQTTNTHGTFIEHDIGQAFADGTFIGVGLPDPSQSTGRYAGATGVITFHGTSTATTVTAYATFKVCVPTD